jgi:hypothetical protein
VHEFAAAVLFKAVAQFITDACLLQVNLEPMLLLLLLLLQVVGTWRHHLA